MLVLNADFRPLSYYPLSLWSWQDAIKAVFLDRVATHILAFEGDSHVEWFEGNYQAYEADKKRRMGAAADEPHRIKYRPLTR